MTTTAEPPTAAAQLKASKAVIRSFVDAWNNRDFGRFQTLMGEDAVLKIGGGVVFDIARQVMRRRLGVNGS